MKNASTKDTRTRISEVELQSAIRRFLDDGGMIKKLPDQKSGPAKRVGMRWHSTELGGELS